MAQLVDALGRVPVLRRHAVDPGQERMPQSLLLVGPEGSGKVAAALELVRAVQCQGDHGICQAGTELCGACHKLAKLVHPDVHFVFPAESSLSLDHYQELLATKAAEPLAPIRQPSSAIIAVGDADDPAPCSVRQLRRFVAVKPFEGRRRAAIVDDAHRMNRAAANALLKTLEEPPPTGLLILCTHQPHLLPATIRSRCALVKVPGLSEEELAGHLQMAHEVEAEVAARMAAVAGGNARRAFDLLHEEAAVVAGWASSLLGLMLQGDRPGLLRGAELVAKGQDPTGAKGAKKLSGSGLTASRDLALRVLDFLVADLTALGRLQAGARLSPVQAERLADMGQRLGGRDPSLMARVLLRARSDIQRNVNVSLVLTHAFAELLGEKAATRS